MKVEVVAARGALLEQRRNCYGGGEKDHSRARKARPARRIPRSESPDLGHPARPCSLIPVPCSLSFHGSNRSVCFVCAATAFSLKGSAKLAPP
jgi:prepilin signal peptidase PulO-like enzyme (type II secretory pathway)